MTIKLFCTGHLGKDEQTSLIMDRRNVFAVRLAVRAREYREVMAELERKQQAGHPITIFRSEAEQIQARFKVTEELWNEIQVLSETLRNAEEETRSAKRDLLNHSMALLQRLNDLQLANIRQFRTFLARPESKEISNR